MVLSVKLTFQGGKKYLDEFLAQRIQEVTDFQ